MSADLSKHYFRYSLYSRWATSRASAMLSMQTVAGLSKLALSFALPASLFVSMTDIPKQLLSQQVVSVLRFVLRWTVPVIAWFGLGLGEVFAWNACNHLCVDAVNVRDSGVWPSGSRTYPGSDQRGDGGTGSSGNQFQRYRPRSFCWR